jgi:adenylyl-sulfate kinase
MNNNQINSDRESLISYLDRCQKLGQNGMVVWFTGLSGSGKTTIARTVEKSLFDQGRLVIILDGDGLRRGINSDIGFSEEDRGENIRRAAEIAKLFQQAGMIVLASFISPRRKLRALARSIVRPGAFIEVYVKASLETCIERDPKGYYKKALSGEIKDYTGISQDYEEPLSPDIIVDTESMPFEECISRILRLIDTYQQTGGESFSPHESTR